MSGLDGIGTTRNKLIMGQHDEVAVFRFAGRNIVVREKDGKVQVQRFNDHGQPAAPSLELK